MDNANRSYFMSDSGLYDESGRSPPLPLTSPRVKISPGTCKTLQPSKTSPAGEFFSQIIDKGDENPTSAHISGAPRLSVFLFYHWSQFIDVPGVVAQGQLSHTRGDVVGLRARELLNRLALTRARGRQIEIRQSAASNTLWPMMSTDVQGLGVASVPWLRPVGTIPE
jgi:hypothetical protein